MNAYCTIVLLVGFATLALGYDVLISNCGTSKTSSKANFVVEDCRNGNSPESQSSSVGRLFPSVLPLFFLSFFVNKKLSALVLVSLMLLNQVYASSSLDGFQIYVNTDEKYFPSKFECNVTSNGVNTPAEFYWYYDSPDTYEYIVYEAGVDGLTMLYKLFDGVQTHIIYAFTTNNNAELPTNRLIQPFIGNRYVLNVADTENGNVCYNVDRNDGTTFYYCLDGEKLSALQEGYDRFTISNYRTVSNGGAYASVVDSIRTKKQARSIISCVVGQNCNCCRAIAGALDSLARTACSGLSLGDELAKSYCYKTVDFIAGGEDPDEVCADELGIC